MGGLLEVLLRACTVKWLFRTLGAVSPSEMISFPVFKAERAYLLHVFSGLFTAQSRRGIPTEGHVGTLHPTHHIGLGDVVVVAQLFMLTITQGCKDGRFTPAAKAVVCPALAHVQRVVEG